MARGTGRQVPDRGAGAAAGRGRLRLASSAIAIRLSTTGRWPSRSRSQARRPTRSARCAKRSGWAPAASPSATSSAAWRRAKPTAPSTRTPGPRSASPRRRRSRRSSSPCTCWRSRSARRAARSIRTAAKAMIRELDQLPLRIEEALHMNDAIEELAATAPAASRLPLPRPRHQLPDRARRRAEAEGDFLHPRRGLSRRRDEARSDRAHRRGPAGRRRSPPTTRCSKRSIGNIQEAKARGGRVIVVTTASKADAFDDILDLKPPRTSSSPCRTRIR